MDDPIRQQFLDYLALRRLSSRTVDAYLNTVDQLGRACGASPETLGHDDVRGWLLGRSQAGYAAASLAQYHAAFKAFYTGCLDRPEVLEGIVRPRVPRAPVHRPLSRREARDLLAALAGTPLFYAVVATMLDTGLRVSEAIHLQTRDVDATRGLILVRHGKNDKQRHVVLSDRLLRILRRTWTVLQPPTASGWLFPARHADPRRAGERRWKDTPVCVDSVRAYLRKAARAAGIRRRVTPHDLRRSYATWLREDGVDLRRLQLLLGHAHIDTTTRYVFVSPEALRATPSPLDTL